MQSHKNDTILRLTALWALAESGLGGWMHALKLPFTGIFVGGFAVVIISLIAHYSGNSFKQIWKATMLVLLVKFAVSPQSPFQAYIAVAFQGIMGAVFYSLISYRPVASLLFGIIAMLESAVQKLIFMTLIFGKSLWEALDSFFKAIAKDFSLPGDTSFSLWVIAIYIGIYFVWGIVLGGWINGLPKRIEHHTVKINAHIGELKQEIGPTEKRRQNKWLELIGILLFIIIALSYDSSGFSGGAGRALYILLRTVAVLLLLIYVVNPMVQWLMQRWISRTKGKRKEELKAVMDLLPEMRTYIKPAYLIAKARHRGISRYTAFIYILLILSLKMNESA
jgi:hypothetical protein